MQKVLDSKISEVPLVAHSSHSSKKRRRVVVIFVSLLLALFLAITLLIFLTIFLNPSSHIQATNIPKSMSNIANFKIDPCEDFFEYSCDNYFSVYPNPTSDSNWNAYKEAQAQIFKKINNALKINGEEKSKAVINTKKYYSFCLNATLKDVKNVVDIIKEFGNSKLFGYNEKSTYGKNKNLRLEDLVEIALKYQSFPFFSIDVSMENPPRIVIRKPYFPKKDLSHFQEAVVEILKIIGNFDKDNKWKLTEEKKDLIEETWRLRKNLSELCSEIFSEPLKTAFKEIFPVFKKMDIDIEKLLLKHLKGVIKPDTIVQVESVKCFEELSSVLASYSKNPEVFKNFIIWTTFQSLFTDMAINPSQTAPQIELQQKDQAYDESKRMNECLEETIEKFEFSIARIYIDTYVNSTTKANIEKIAETLKHEVLKNKYNFFDDDTYSKAKLKAKKTAFSILFPDFILDNDALDKYYGQFKDYASTDNYWDMNIGHKLWLSLLQSRVTGPSRNPDHWLASPIYPMAFAHQTLNRVYVLAGLAAEPIHFFKAPPEVQYGGIGMTMAHELTHLFLPHGTKYDENGKMNNWLSNASEISFKQNQKCFINFYNKLSMYKRPINGTRVLREATADSGGLFLAYKALESLLGKEELKKKTTYDGLNLTKSQTFFLSYAQKMCSVYKEKESERFFFFKHTFNNIRVQGTLQNSKEFSRAFNCKLGSTYNPEHKCLLYDD